MHTASGSEAAIETDDTLPLLSCVSDINPVQDLHGYSKPWAGGAGANMLHNTIWTETPYGIELDTPSSGSYNIALYNDTLALGDYTIKDFVEGSNTTHQILVLKNGSVIKYLTEGSYTFTVDNASDSYIVRLYTYPSNTDTICKPIMVSGSSINAYEPYANICPISGHTDVTVTVASTSGGSGDDYTVSLGSTYYGGTLGVTTGELEVTWENIASYAGETLPGEWLSSLDEYTALGTPTTGAQVVYELATPQTFTLTKEQIITLLGDNYIRSDTGDIEITYVTNVIDPLLKYLLENR